MTAHTRSAPRAAAPPRLAAWGSAATFFAVLAVLAVLAARLRRRHDRGRGAGARTARELAHLSAHLRRDLGLCDAAARDDAGFARTGLDPFGPEMRR